MQATGLTALVATAGVFVLLVLIASLLSFRAVRVGRSVETTIKAGSLFRYHVHIHPAPTPMGGSSPSNEATDSPAQGPEKNTPDP